MMFIAKFHKLIQSKVLWIIILGVVVVSFVGLYIQTPGERSAREQDNAAGRMGGKLVPQEVFRAAYSETYLGVLLSLGQAIPMTSEVDRELREMTWRRLATQAAAAEMGIEARDSEVVAAIRGTRIFQSEGQFDPRLYQQFVQGALQGLGISQRAFEEHVRSEVRMQKLRQALDSATLVAPLEVVRAQEMLGATFEIEYALLPIAAVRADSTVSEDEARAAFAENPAAFTLPPLVQVQYLEFPVADFLEQVEPIDEETALQLYDDRATQYVRTVTVPLAAEAEAPANAAGEGEETAAETPVDETVVAATDEPAAEPETRVEAIPFEEVRDEIMAELTLERARTLAADQATDVAVELLPGRAGLAPDEAQVLARYALTLKDLPPFSATEDVAELPVGPRLNEEAFRLRRTPADYISEPLSGPEAVYVLLLRERIPARVPTFEEVAEEVRAVVLEREVQAALNDRATELLAAAREALAAGGSWAALCAEQGLALEQISELNAWTSGGREPLAQTLLQAALNVNEGEMIAPLAQPDGIVLAYVARRTPPTGEQAPLSEAQVARFLTRNRGELLFNAWSESLWQALEIEDFSVSRRVDDEDEDDDREDEAWEDEEDA